MIDPSRFKRGQGFDAETRQTETEDRTSTRLSALFLIRRAARSQLHRRLRLDSGLFPVFAQSFRMRY